MFRRFIERNIYGIAQRNIGDSFDRRVCQVLPKGRISRVAPKAGNIGVLVSGGNFRRLFLGFLDKKANQIAITP